MIEWSEMHLAIRDTMRRFVESEVVPRIKDIEHGETPPYEVLRKMVATFGLKDMAEARFTRQIAKEKERLARGEAPAEKKPRTGPNPEAGNEMAMRMIPIIELCKYSPGMVTALGVSMGLTANAIMSRGTVAQKERWALDLLTLDKIGAWAITEPGSGSDAFGAMKSTARRDGDGYVLNGSKTFITNGPYADTIVFICKLDEGNDAKDRKIVSFVLDRGMAGLTQSKPLRKMGLHGSPTGELFLDDVRGGQRPPAGRDRRGAGPQRREGHVRLRAHGRGGDGARHRRAVPQALRRVRQDARAVRQPHRRPTSSSSSSWRRWRSRA